VWQVCADTDERWADSHAHLCLCSLSPAYPPHENGQSLFQSLQKGLEFTKPMKPAEVYERAQSVRGM
jgi:hypothetical protein